MQHQPPIYTIGQENLVFIVTMLDDLVHINEHPFCSDPECPCKEDATLNRVFLTKPLDAGLLTNSEALRIYFGTQLVPTQDGERITDEEIAEIMAAPSPQDEQIDDLDDSKQQWLSEHL